VSVSAPPRPAGPSDPVGRAELDAPVEARIEEGRRRTRRRKQAYAALAALLACAGAVLFAVGDRTGRTQGPSAARTGRPIVPALETASTIAFIGVKREAKGPAFVNELSVVNADGGASRVLVSDAQAEGLAWSPDGRRIAFVSPRAGDPDINVINADGTGRRRLTHNDDYSASFAPAWSPDGRALAFVRVYAGQSAFQIYVMNVDGAGQLRLVSKLASGGVGGLTWSPDGRSIVVATARHTQGGPKGFEVYAVNADGSGKRNLTHDWALDGFPVWSPDGREIAFRHSGTQPGIYVMNADGSALRMLAHGHSSRWDSPAWSPDGHAIAFDRRRGIHSEIYVINADGSGERRLTTRGAQPLWSPDGRTIAFRSSRDGNPEIYLINADGTGQRRLTHDPLVDLFVAWSPARSSQDAKHR